MIMKQVLPEWMVPDLVMETVPPPSLTRPLALSLMRDNMYVVELLNHRIRKIIAE